MIKNLDKFDKTITFVLGIPLLVLYLLAFSKNFVAAEWLDLLSSKLGFIYAALISIVVYKYQFNIWIPAEEINRYSFKWFLNLFLVFIGAPLMGYLIASLAISVGFGKVATYLSSTPIESEEHIMLVKEHKRAKAGACKRSLVMQKTGYQLGQVSLCIEEPIFNHIKSPTVVTMRVQNSIWGKLVKDWQVSTKS